MAGIQFERKVSLDTVITLLVLLTALVGAYFKIGSRLERLEDHDAVLWHRFIGDK